jgi:hypothetical protein
MRLRPRVLHAQSRTLAAGATPDSYVDQIIKYIPAETITAYQAVLGFAYPDGAPPAGQPDPSAGIMGWVAGVGLIFTFGWVLLGAHDADKKEPLAWSQACVALLAFAVWLFAINSQALRVWFPSLVWNERYGSILLVIATVMVLPLLGRLLNRIFGD